MKKCSKCGIEQSLSDFYLNPRMKDGHLKICKKCKQAASKKRVLLIRSTNPDLYEEILRSRRERRAKNKTERKLSPKELKTKSDWHRNNRQKARCHYIVHRAILKGELVRQPCQVCGATDGVQGHHEDYSRPLDVWWLCPLHHVKRHLEIIREQKSQKPK